MYGMKEHRPLRDYFASIVTPTGATMWEHVRTNLGRKVAYAMIAKHHEGHGVIAGFRDDTQATAYDREALAQGSDGILRRNPNLGANWL